MTFKYLLYHLALDYTCCSFGGGLFFPLLHFQQAACLFSSVSFPEEKKDESK